MPSDPIAVRRLVDAPFSCREKVAAMENFPIALGAQPPPQHTGSKFSGTTLVPQPPRASRGIPDGKELTPSFVSTGPTAETYVPEALRHKSVLTAEEHNDVMAGIAAQLLSAFQKKLHHQSEVIAAVPTEDLIRIVLDHTQAHATTEGSHSPTRAPQPIKPSAGTMPVTKADIESAVGGLTITEALAEDINLSFARRAVAAKRSSIRAPTSATPQAASPPKLPKAAAQPTTAQATVAQPSSPVSPFRPSSPIHNTTNLLITQPTLRSTTSPVLGVTSTEASIFSEDSQGVASPPTEINTIMDGALSRGGLFYKISNVNTKLTKTRAQLHAEEEEMAMSQKVPKIAPVVEYEIDTKALESMPAILPRADGIIPVLSTRPDVLDLQLRREYLLAVNESAVTTSTDQLNSVRAVLGDLKRIAAAEAQWHSEVNSREEQLSALEAQQAELKQILVSIQGALAATKAGKEIPDTLTQGLRKSRPSADPFQSFYTFTPFDGSPKPRRLLNVPGPVKPGGSFSRASRSVSKAITKEAASPDPKRPESPEGDSTSRNRRRELEAETRLLLALHAGGQQVDSCTYKLSSNFTRLLGLGKQFATYVQKGKRSSTSSGRDGKPVSGAASDSLSQSRARIRHESVVSMAAESEFGGLLEHLDAYSGIGEAVQKPLADMTEDDLLQLALFKECEGELRALVGHRDVMKGQLEAGEEELVRIQGHLAVMVGPREGETRELAVELAPLLDRNRDSDADSSDMDESDVEEQALPEEVACVGEAIAPVDSMMGFEHVSHNAAVQCDLGAGDLTEAAINNKDSIARFERLFRSEKDLLTSLRQLAVSISHVLTFHWSMEAELTCKSCMQVFHKPSTVWPCGHVVCENCVPQDVDDGLIQCGECGSFSEAGVSPNDVLEGLCRVHHSLPFSPGEEHPYESSTYAALVEAMAMADVSVSGLTRAASVNFRRASRIGDPAHTTRDQLATLHELVRSAKERVDIMNCEAATESPTSRRQVTILS